MPKYVVCQNRSIILPNGNLLRNGQVVPEGMKPALIKEWQASNFIRPAGSAEGGETETVGVVKTDGEIAEAPKPVVQNGKFTHDPDGLQGVPLEELNVMLVDLNADPAETVEEAIGLLSQDYNA